MRRCVTVSAIALSLCIALLSLGCVSSQYLIGQGLNDIGKQFIATGNLYDSAYEAKSITKEEYGQWAEFAPKFQEAYQQAYMAWLVGDKGTEDQIKTMRGQLEAYALKLLNKSKSQ